MMSEKDQYRINVEVACAKPTKHAGILCGVYDLSTEGRDLFELLETKIRGCGGCVVECDMRALHSQLSEEGYNLPE